MGCSMLQENNEVMIILNAGLSNPARRGVIIKVIIIAMASDATQRVQFAADLPIHPGCCIAQLNLAWFPWDDRRQGLLYSIPVTSDEDNFSRPQNSSAKNAFLDS